MFTDDQSLHKKEATNKALKVISEKIPVVSERSIYKLLAPIAKIHENHNLMVEIIQNELIYKLAANNYTTEISVDRS